MASGKITNKNTISGSISSGNSLNASVTAGSGTTDHNRLTNRTLKDQHPVEAITGLREELDSKLDSKTALPLIEEAVQNKAKGLYFDAKKELAKKSYWYLTSEIDPVTKLGTKDSIISGPYDLGAGGGGGGGGVTTVSVKPFEWPSTVVVGGEAKAIINWSSTIGENKEPTGDGTLYLTVNNKQVLVLPNQKQGLIELNLSPYLIAGNNNVQIKILDAYGTTGILVRTTAAVTLELKSNFNSALNYTGAINYTYVPYGDVEKIVHFIIDGEEIGTQVVNATGEQQTYRITGLSHGSHNLEVYFTAVIAGDTVASNKLFYDLVYYAEGNTAPIIVSTFNQLEQEQYISFNIPYRVFISGKNEFEVSFLVNGDEVNKTTVSTAEQYWNYQNDIPGNYNLVIKCGKTTKEFNIYIKPSTINVVPVTTDLVLALDARGRNNNEQETRNIWEDKTNSISCELINFNWKSNGWLNDNDGNSILRVSGDARIKIPYEPFKEDFKNRGKTIEFEIATSAVRNYSSTIISCLDKQSTDFYEAATSFVEEDFRHSIFTVNIDNTKISKSDLTTGSHVFNYNGTIWTLDSEKTVELETYGISLAGDVINPEGTHENEFLLPGDNIVITYTLAARGFYVTPQIAAFRSQQSAISTQYKEDEHVRLSFVIEKNTDKRVIWMYINGIASGAMQYPVDDNFRQLESNIIEIGSNDAVLDIYNIRIYDNNLTSKQIVNNWIADTQNAALKAERYTKNDNYNDKNELVISKLPVGLPYIIWDIQPLPEFKGDKRLGNAIYVDPTDSSRNFTSERAQYNVQGTSSSVYPTKNIRIKFKAKDGDPNFFWINDNGDTIKKFPITYPGGIGDNYFTFKVDYASSEGANNVELVKLYNDASIKLGILTPPQRKDLKVRVGIDGFPIAAFYRDEEGKDIFCTKANFNNDKANEDVYGFEEGDESWETTNNSADETKYKVPSTEENFENGFEIRFPDEDDWNGDLTKLKAMTAWVASTNREAATGEELPEPITYKYLKTTTGGEDGGASSEEVTETFTHDIPEYRLAKFRVELEDWFNVDSTIFYYVFTLLFLMIDSRAKNAFPTYFKSRQAGDGGDRWFWIPYDMDTAIGIDNKGKLSFDYNLEDTDMLDGAAVYNGQDSVMWNNLRDMFSGEIAAMYAEMRLSKLISYEEVEKRFEEHQGKWSENLFNEDAKNKYIAPLDNGDNYLEMLQGSKSQQRKWWLYNRFKYIDSKYNAGEAVQDFVQFRAYAGAGEVKPNITITPYADIYATVSYANGRPLVAKRAKRNEPIILENPFTLNETENDQETYIYSASQLKSIGDISGFHPDTVKIGNAIKLQELKVGDKDPNYQNPYLKELTVGSNILLKSIDARNCTNLGTGVTSAPDLSKCINIEEIYFTGTKIKGIVLPDGGNIKKLHLPGTLTNLTIKNQPLLTDLNIEGTNTTITKEVVNLDTYTLVGKVIKKPDWLDSLGYSILVLSDDETQINLILKDKTIYDSIELNTTSLVINCNSIDIRYDLINNEEVRLADYTISNYNTVELNTDNKVLNIKSNIDFANNNVQAPTKDDYGVSLIEALWLENIPSTSIKSELMVGKMKPNTAVRLIGINETYNTYEEIKHFYDILDNKKGLTADGETVNKAQITGTINIDTISYANKCTLENRYPEVKINAKQVICTVTFINEGSIHKVENVVSGYTATNPTTPVKLPPESQYYYYYIFERWTYNNGQTIWNTETIIDRDIELIAEYSQHIHDYTVTFDTASDLVIADPASITIQYNSIISEPILTGIPEKVDLKGWFVDGTDLKWNYETDQVKHDTLLVAKWDDVDAPTLDLKRINYNTFSYDAKDNLGIIGWAVTKNSAEEPTEWNSIKSTTKLKGQYEITSAGTYYFWITDGKNTIKVSLIADSINVTTTPGISKYNFTENETDIETNFALRGTILKLNIVVDDQHYKDLDIVFSGSLLSDDRIFTVSQNILIDLKCTPRDFKVTFDVRGKGESAKAPEQIITYLHLVERPISQYYQATGEVIDSWYLDTAFTHRWDFETSQVEGDTILYAKWVPYHNPTILTLEIPEGTDAARTVNITYSQYNIDSDHKVTIDWGDGSLKSSSSVSNDLISLGHTYAKAGTYKVALLGTGGGTNAWYRLGDSYARALVTPESYLADIDLAWDINTVADGAFRASSLKHTGLTEYMTSVSVGCYANCKDLESIEIPESIITIGDQAFSACRNAKGTIKVPANIQKIGHNAFANCDNITSFELICNGNPELQTYICYNNIGLTEIKISDHLTLPSRMFAYCSSLEELNINNNLADQVFSNCTGLKKLISDSKHFGQQAFSGCSNLETVILTNKELTFDSYVFDACPKLETFGPLADAKGNMENLKYDFNYAWDTSIPAYAFQRSWNANSRKNVKEVTLPAGLLQIGTLAFNNATALSKINLPESLNIIGEQAFDSCQTLSSLIIPVNVYDIKPKAFAGCTGLTKVNLKARSSETKITIPDNSWFINSNPDMTLYVPADIYTDPDSLIDRYGEHWNACSKDASGNWRYIMPVSFTEN